MSLPPEGIVFNHWASKYKTAGADTGQIYAENLMRCPWVATALIAYLLLQLTHQSQTAITGLLTFAKLVRCNLMHRRRIDRLLEPPSSNRPPEAQQQLAFS